METKQKTETVSELLEMVNKNVIPIVNGRK